MEYQTKIRIDISSDGNLFFHVNFLLSLKCHIPLLVKRILLQLLLTLESPGIFEEGCRTGPCSTSMLSCISIYRRTEGLVTFTHINSID